MFLYAARLAALSYFYKFVFIGSVYAFDSYLIFGKYAFYFPDVVCLYIYTVAAAFNKLGRKSSDRSSESVF